MTCFISVTDDTKTAIAGFKDETVAMDGKLIASRYWGPAGFSGGPFFHHPLTRSGSG
jgi:hypothetical protein